MGKSFSSEVKNELCELYIQSSKEAASELAAMLLFGENEDRGDVVVKTHHALAAARIQVLFKKSINEEVNIDVLENKSAYLIRIPTETVEELGVYFSEDGEISLDEDIFLTDEDKRAFLRGAFIVSGTIADPEKSYSCEFFTYNEYMAQLALELLEEFDLHANIVKRKNYYVAYMKDSTSISDFLSVVGAHKNMMEYMNTFISKTLSNKINRQNNCQIANLGKTVNASVRQRGAIEKIINTPVWDKLDDDTKKLAQIRLEYPDDSLEQIGKRMEPPVSKSIVSRRLNKIIEKAEN